MFDSTRWRVARAALVLTLLITSLAMAALPGAPRAATAQESSWSPPSTVYIPQTGHTVDGWFLDMWREGGGVGVFGNPITPEMTREDGVVVQYYQYARFEYWPEGDADGNTVTLGDIGADLRPAAITRLPLGGTSAKAAEMTRVAMAWEPLDERDVQPDSDTYLYVSETGHSVYDGFLTFWRDAGLQTFLGNPLSEEYVLGSVHYQVFERGQLRWEPGGIIEIVPVGQQLADQKRLPQDPTAQGDVPTYDESLFVPPPPPRPATLAERSAANPDAERWIDIDLTNQYLRAYQGDVVVLETSISSGTAGWETPTGTFYIGRKVEVDDMQGTVAAESWFVPDVPHAMYFTDVGHAIHGTYWHNNFGTPMSHGCINMPLGLAAEIYGWAGVGTRVVIHY